MYKLLLIENQIRQYKEITQLFRKLDGNYDIYPDDKDYIEFIDRIRVHLNKNYNDSIRQNTLAKILEDIEKTNPDIFIIDQVLVGCFNSETGLDLAMKLRKNNFSQPIIFLSRTSESDEKVMKELRNVEGIKFWVPKGYAGKEILLEEYFKENVLEKIPILLKKSEFDNIKSKIEEILCSKYFDADDFKSELFKILKEILNRGSIEEFEKVAILKANFGTFIMRKSFYEVLKNK